VRTAWAEKTSTILTFRIDSVTDRRVSYASPEVLEVDVSATPDDLGGEPAPGTKLASGIPIRVDVHVVWPSLEDLYIPPSLGTRFGGGRGECICDCGSKSGGGSGK